jgi:tetratricopeptide (TPR) repeat protein
MEVTMSAVEQVQTPGSDDENAIQIQSQFVKAHSVRISNAMRINMLRQQAPKVDFSLFDHSEEHRQILDVEKRVSECILWKLQEEYYHNHGVEAWDQVPFFVTSNAFIGENYADMVLAFLKDYKDKLDVTEPLYIVELATGTGCFSFHMIQALLEKIACFEHFKDLKIRYVMTDFTENNAKFWEANEKLIPFIEKGILDTAVFRPEDDTEIHLRQSGETISPGDVKNPMMVVANYFFDTIRQDIFRVVEHQLYETFLTFFRDNPKYTFNDPVTFEQLETTATHFPISKDHYADPRLNAVLQYYCRTLKNASVVFPIGAFNCLRNLQALSNDKVVLLSSDKGFTDLSYMEGHWVPSYALHGSFSYMVNYNAIQQYFELQGGKTFSAGENCHTLKTALCVLLKDDKNPLEELTYTFKHRVENLNPINNMFYARNLADTDEEGMDPSRLLMAYMSFINMTQGDPNGFCSFGRRIVKALRSMPNRDRYIEEAMVKTIDRSRKHCYALKQSSNSLYWMGKLYYELDQYAKGADVLHEALRLYGPDPDTLYLIACCYEMMQDYKKALQYFEETLIYEPGCEYTLRGIERMKSKL